MSQTAKRGFVRGRKLAFERSPTLTPRKPLMAARKAWQTYGGIVHECMCSALCLMLSYHIWASRHSRKAVACHACVHSQAAAVLKACPSLLKVRSVIAWAGVRSPDHCCNS
jgi:hypothetical protein